MAIQAKNLRKTFGEFVAVDDVSLDILDGQFIAFLGPNGAGKSTTVQMLTTLSTPSAGDIYLNGYDTKTQMTAARAQIGVVFQHTVLDETLTVAQNLKFRKQMGHNDANRLQMLMEKFHLVELAQKKFGLLSGGQQRRVDIVRALMVKPRILFLDEPTTALDIQTRQLIWRVLDELRVEEHLTIFLTTHYLEEAEQADEVYILDHGKLLANGTPAQLKQQYAHNVLRVFQPFQAPNDWVTSQANVYQITDPNAMLAELLRQNVTQFDYRQGTLDDVFVALTGREIR